MADQSMRRWAVLVSGFLTMLCGCSLMGATSMLHVALLDKYRESVTVTAWCGSFFVGFFCFASPLGSIIINKISCRACIVCGGILNLIGFSTSVLVQEIRHLYITYGVIAGTGQALCYTGTFVACSFYFHKQRSFAVGVAVTGFALGLMVYPLLVNYILSSYGLNGTFLLLGGIGFHSCVFGMVVKPHPLEVKFQDISKMASVKSTCSINQICNSTLNYLKLFKDGPFVLFCISIFWWSQSLGIVVVHITEFFHLSGMELGQSAFVTSLIGFGSIFSRILTGLAAVDGGIDSNLLYWGSHGILAFVTLFVGYYGGSNEGGIIFATIFGLYSGGTWALLSPITVELVGLSKLATCFSVEMVIAGIGMMIGPIIGSYILGDENNYVSLFIVCGVYEILATVFGLLTNVFINIRSKENPSPLQSKPSLHSASLRELDDVSLRSIFSSLEYISRDVVTNIETSELITDNTAKQETDMTENSSFGDDNAETNCNEIQNLSCLRDQG